MRTHMRLALVIAAMAAVLGGCTRMGASDRSPGMSTSGPGKGGAVGSAAPTPMRPPDAGGTRFGTKLGGR